MLRYQNPYFEFTTLYHLRASVSADMAVEEAVIVGLLAVGMSILVAMTVMIFW